MAAKKTAKKSPQKKPSSVIVGTYEVTLSVPGPPGHLGLRQALNKAWGFKDGECNKRVGDFYEGKPGSDNPAFVEAHHAMDRFHPVTLVVTLYKDGSKKFKVKK